MANSRSLGRLVFLLILIAAMAAIGWYFWQKRADQKPEYTTTAVSRGEIVQVVTATGDLEPVLTTEVSSQISGLILDVYADFNTPVKAGQILAKLDPATYEQRLKQAEADLASTTATNTLTRLNTERIRELHRKQLVSQQELDQAEAQLAQSNAQLLIRKAAVEDAMVNLHRCTIYSPIDGIVVSRATEKGKTVSASLSAPTLFTVVGDLAKMQINAAVAEADIGQVEIDQTVNFTVDAFPGRQFRGRVMQIRNLPKTTQNVVTYQTIIEAHNADLKLKPGMTANVSIVVAQRHNVLRLSNAALRVRLPEGVTALPEQKPEEKKDGSSTSAAPTSGGALTTTSKPMSEEQRRAAVREIMREAGMQFGTPPTPEVLAKAQQLAKERGIEIDFSRFGGRGRGDRGDRAGSTAAPITRTVYKLLGDSPETYQLQTTTVRLGITDGIYTEVLDGLSEGDVLALSVTLPGSSPVSMGPQNSNNPFQQQRGFGGGGGFGGRGR